MGLFRYASLVALSLAMACWPAAAFASPFIDETPPTKVGSDRWVQLKLEEPAALSIVWDCVPTWENRDCASTDYFIESVIEDTDGLTVLYHHHEWASDRYNAPAIAQIFRLRFRKVHNVVKGVPVVELQTEQIPGSLGQTVTLYRPTNKRLGFAFDKTEALLGYYPSGMYVLFNPDMRQDVDRWLEAMLTKGCIYGSAFNAEVPSLADMDNLLVVAMVAGGEACIFSEMSSLPWVLDYTMRPIEYGPDAAILRLPDGVLKPDKTILTQARAATSKVVRAAFPRISGSDFDMVSTGSRTLYVTLLAPAARLKPSDPAFDGYWLKAQISVMVNINGDARNGLSIDLILTVSDGWLPKWRRPGRPPQAHLAQAHLSPDSKRFQILSYVRDRIADGFIKELKATREQ